jgi:hypothetical protein
MQMPFPEPTLTEQDWNRLTLMTPSQTGDAFMRSVTVLIAAHAAAYADRAQDRNDNVFQRVRLFSLCKSTRIC